jgi:hypothetical protein
MDLVPAVIIDASWIFFAAWGMALAALSVIAFGRDILPEAQRATARKKHLGS